VRLRERGWGGVESVVSCDHAGVKKAIAESLPPAVWKRCYVQFPRNILDDLPRRAKVHYTVEGKGEPVLLIQGFGQNQANWSGAIKGLSNRFQ
jgi:hypothetical protein